MNAYWLSGFTTQHHFMHRGTRLRTRWLHNIPIIKGHNAAWRCVQEILKPHSFFLKNTSIKQKLAVITQGIKKYLLMDIQRSINELIEIHSCTSLVSEHCPCTGLCSIYRILYSICMSATWQKSFWVLRYWLIVILGTKIEKEQVTTLKIEDNVASEWEKLVPDPVLRQTSNQPCDALWKSMKASLLILVVVAYTLHPVC